VGVEIGAEGAEHRVPIDRGLLGCEVDRERAGGDAALAEQSVADEFIDDPEAGNAGERDRVAAIAGLGERHDAAAAADGAQHRSAGAGRRGVVGLEHADDAIAGDRRVDHGEVARLEDVERHVGARQEERRRKRKDRDDLG